MPKPEKIKEVESMTEKLKSAKSAYITEYRGLTVAEITELRNKLRDAGSEYKVVKNRLTKIALEQTGLSAFKDHFQGPVAMAITQADPVKPAKTLVDFAKAHDKLKIKAGFLDKNALSLDQIKALANLPSREVLIGKLVGSLSSPIYGFLRVLQGPSYGLVNVLDQIRKQKESAGQPA